MKRKRVTVTTPPSREEAQVQKQEKFLQTLPPKLRTAVRSVKKCFQRLDGNDLWDRYELGERVKAIQDYAKEEGKAQYGSGLIENLRKLFGWNQGVLYGALAIANAFDESAILWIIRTPMANGRIMPYGHVRALADVEDEEMRDALLTQASNECWTYEELEAEIRQETGKKKDDNRGRPLIVPKDLDGLIRQQDRIAHDFLKRNKDVWEKSEHTLLAEAEKFPADRITPDRLKNIAVHVKTLVALSTKAKARADEAQKVHDLPKAKLEKSETKPGPAGEAPATKVKPSDGKRRSTNASPKGEETIPRRVAVV